MSKNDDRASRERQPEGYANPQLLITTEGSSERLALADGDATRPEIAVVVTWTPFFEIALSPQ